MTTRQNALSHHDEPEFSIALPDTLTAARSARRATVAACRRWGLPDLSDTAELLTSEIVTNAVRHAQPPFALRLALMSNDRIRVEVTDASPVIPQADPRPDPYQPGHHGLHILQALATDWGHHPAGGGKTVWYELAPETTHDDLSGRTTDAGTEPA